MLKTDTMPSLSHTAPIVLIGLKGCGKSTIGKLLAERLSCPWRDTDACIENEYHQQHQTQRTCAEIVTEHGISYFKALEQQVFQQLITTKLSVISTGGSSLFESHNREHLPENSIIYYLEADLAILESRWKNHPPPWLTKTICDPQSIQAINARHQRYCDIAHVRITTHTQSPEVICQHIEQHLNVCKW